MQAFHYIIVVEDYICFQQRCLPKSNTNLSWSAGKTAYPISNGVLTMISGQVHSITEYSCAMKSQFRGIGNHVSGTGNHQVLNASLLANALVANAYPDISLVDLISITDALASLDEYVKIW